MINRQPNVTFDHKSAEYEDFDLSAYNEGTITITKPILLGFL